MTGVVRNYGEKTPTSPIPFPMIYKRTVANDANSTWNTAQWTPDVVVINLGTNDFSSQPTYVTAIRLDTCNTNVCL